jgi:hypothetical protein
MFFHSETVNWKKHNTVNVFRSGMVTVNVFYSKMVNSAKQEQCFKNHKHELNYGKLILQDRKIFENYFYSNTLFSKI